MEVLVFLSCRKKKNSLTAQLTNRLTVENYLRESKSIVIQLGPVLKHVLWLSQLALERELLLNEGMPPLPLCLTW